MPQLLRVGQVTRTFIERMLREGLLESWRRRLIRRRIRSMRDTRPPGHELNTEQESALKAIRARLSLASSVCSCSMA